MTARDAEASNNDLLTRAFHDFDPGCHRPSTVV
jgi:hypothetical protein